MNTDEKDWADYLHDGLVHDLATGKGVRRSPSATGGERDSGFDGSKDIPLVCVQCKKSWTFTTDEQLFFIELKFTMPLRCKSCRSIARKTRNFVRPNTVK